MGVLVDVMMLVNIKDIDLLKKKNKVYDIYNYVKN